MNELDKIKDGYKFQQIVAEYFRSIHGLKKYHIGSVNVTDNGVGGDDGCDILVEFIFEDTIFSHSHRWVVECKSQKRAVNLKDINFNSVNAILEANNAQGYLLICKNDATAQLKRNFNSMNSKSHYKYITWNGSHLWRKFCESKSLLEAFFADYYKKYFIDNNAENEYISLINKFNTKLKEGGKL